MELVLAPLLEKVCDHVNAKIFQSLPNFIRVGILPLNMNTRSAYNYHHHYVQPPPGREVYMRVPVIE